MQCMGGQWCIDVPAAGSYALFCEHDPVGVRLALPQAPAVTRAFASHHHDRGGQLASASAIRGRWMRARSTTGCPDLLQNRGEDLLRMKGVLNLRGETRRYVFHAVHMMFDGRPERAWGDVLRTAAWSSSVATWIVRSWKPALPRASREPQHCKPVGRRTGPARRLPG
jgi:G3E family GTPase